MDRGIITRWNLRLRFLNPCLSVLFTLNVVEVRVRATISILFTLITIRVRVRVTNSAF